MGLVDSRNESGFVQIPNQFVQAKFVDTGAETSRVRVIVEGLLREIAIQFERNPHENMMIPSGGDVKTPLKISGLHTISLTNRICPLSW
jgi:hypothetical protein